MAGKKGRSGRKRKKTQRPATASVEQQRTDGGADPSAQQVEPGRPAEFDAAVSGILGDEALSQGSPFPTPGTGAPQRHQPAAEGSPPATDEESFLGIDAWQALIEAPFRSLSLVLRIPEFERLGKLRSKMLAQPSYPLYRHYVKQWLTDNPDDELFVCKVMTGAALATVLQEMWMIYVADRARRQAAAKEPGTVRVDQLHTDN